MAIGLLGFPLLRGNSEEIETKYIKNPTAYIEHLGGRAVVSVIDSNESDNQTVEFLTTENLDTSNFVGISSNAFQSDGVKGVDGIVIKANKIPVQIFGEITDLAAGVAVTENGLFTQASEAYPKRINAAFRGGAIYKAYSTNNIEVDCAMLDLFSGGYLPVSAPVPAPVKAKAQAKAQAEAKAQAKAQAEAKVNNAENLNSLDDLDGDNK